MPVSNPAQAVTKQDAPETADDAILSMMQRGFSQRQMAEVLGVSQSTVSRRIKRIKRHRQVQKALEPGSQDDFRPASRESRDASDSRRSARAMDRARIRNHGVPHGDDDGYIPSQVNKPSSPSWARGVQGGNQRDAADAARRTAAVHQLVDIDFHWPEWLVETFGLEHVETALAELFDGRHRDLHSPAGWVRRRVEALAAGGAPLTTPEERYSGLSVAEIRPSPETLRDEEEL